MILKFPITDPLPYNEGKCTIPVHCFRSDFLKVEYQRGQLCIWVNTNQPGNAVESTELYIQGTGTTPPVGAKYIGSCQNPNDQCVWHIFRELL